MITFSYDQILHKLKSGISFPFDYHIPKNDLVKLLNEASIYDIEKLLRQDCFSLADLLAIVNDYDSLYNIKYDTIKLLYFYFNPKRQWKESKTPLLEMYYMANRAGHVLGLKDKVTFEVEQKKYKLKTNGEFAAISLAHVTEFLSLFVKKFPSETGQIMLEAFKHSLSHILPMNNAYKENAHHAFHRRYLNNKLVCLASGWEDHGVGLALYGDYLVYTNRGEAGDKKNGSKIFKITDRRLITLDFIKQLMVRKFKNAKEFHAHLAKVIDLSKPVAGFRAKPQKYGTCSFANRKAMIEPLKVLVDAGPYASPEQLHACYANEYNRRNYKFFGNFVRDAEIDEIIKSMFYADHKHLQYFYVALAKQIIREHHGKNRGYIKDDEEIRRACDFYERIPYKIKRLINNDFSFVSLMEEVKEKNQQLTTGKKYFWPQTFFVRSKQVSYKVKTEKGCIISINDNPTPPIHFSYENARRVIVATA